MRRIIETDRLTLRPIALSDAPAMSVLAGDIDIARMTGSIPHPFPLLAAEIRTMIFKSAWLSKREYSYAITLNGGEMKGIASLFRRNGSEHFELGYWLGRPYWGRGYMTETCQALISEAENTLGIDTLVAGVFYDNDVSMHLLKKIGFISTGESEPYFSAARLCKAKSLSFIRHKPITP